MQGVAEVVPVSSSAQLTLLPWLLGWDDPHDAGAATTLAAGLHAGSCAGLLWALRADVRALRRRDLALLTVATAPAALAGALVPDEVERRLGRPGQVAGLLAAAGALMWLADDLRPQRHRTVGMADAAVAGLAQAAALAPGVSRAGATLTALRLREVERTAAARFSLLQSLPITAGAALLTLGRADRRLLGEVAGPLAVGTPIAAAAAAVAVRRTTSPPSGGLRGAALYRLGLAAAVAVRLRRAARRTQEGSR